MWGVRGRRVAAGLSVVVGLVAPLSCSSSTKLSGSPSATAADSSTTTTVAAGASTVPSTTADSTTTEPATAPATSAPTSIVAPTVPETTASSAPVETAPPVTDAGPPLSVPPASKGTCAGLTAIPADATDVQTISGDIDGDLHPDQVTSYTASDDVPHIHAVLAFGKESDVEIPLGFSDTVSISFEDFDHSAGAAIPPPVAVLALAQGNAGSELAAFLTLTKKYCIQPWTLGDTMFVVRISQQGPYTGLLCDHTAGQTHYLQVSANQQGDGSWVITSDEIRHNFTKAKLTSLADQIVPDDPNIAHEYGDIVNCDHAPIFP
jgi:hypothetical protein